VPAATGVTMRVTVRVAVLITVGVRAMGVAVAGGRGVVSAGLVEVGLVVLVSALGDGARVARLFGLIIFRDSLPVVVAMVLSESRNGA